MDITDIILHGDNNQKANQLLVLLQSKQFTPEQLDKLIPHEKEFLGELISVIKKQTEIDQANYDNFINISLNIIDNLLLSMKEAPTESERLQFLKTIEEIHARMVEIKKDEKDKDTKTKGFFAFLCAFLMAIFFVLTAGAIGRKKDKA